MREFIISTESNADLSEEFIRENNICVIPHYYTIEEKIYGDGEELSYQEFYREMRNKKKVGTMASNPAVILEKFSGYAKAGKDILHISFSSALSGGYGNIVMIANEVMDENKEMNIKVVDTLSASVGEMLMIERAIALKKAGKSLEETAAEIEQLSKHICVQFTVDDLNHLYRGGRLSRASAIIGTIAGIKPILHINDEGKLVALDKARGRKKSLALLVDRMEECVGRFKNKQMSIGIIHGDCEDEAKYLKSLIAERFGYEDFIIRPIGPSIGAHSGPGAIAVVFLGDHR